MAKRQVCVLVGTILFLSGLFRPFHFWAGPHDTVIVVALAALSLLVAWRKHYRSLWIVGIGAVASLIYTVVTFQANMRGFQAQYGIKTVELEMIDWAIPLVGIVMLCVPGLCKATQSSPTIRVDLLSRPIPGPAAWALSATSFLLPLLAIEAYSAFRATGYAPAIYGMSVAIAAGFWETDWRRRLFFSIPVAIVGLPLAATFDVIMILAIALAAGVFAVGCIPVAVRQLWWANGIYRVGRMLASGGLVFFTARLGLPTSGRDTAGGGDVTETFIAFAAMTYLPICGMILIDGIALLFGGRARPSVERPATTVG